MSAAAKAPATTEKKGEKGPIKAMFGKWLKFPTGRYVGLSSGFKVRRILAPKSVASRKGVRPLITSEYVQNTRRNAIIDMICFFAFILLRNSAPAMVSPVRSSVR